MFLSFMNRFSFSFVSIDKMSGKKILYFVIFDNINRNFFLFLSKQFDEICFFLSQMKQMTFDDSNFLSFDLIELFFLSSRRRRDDDFSFFCFCRFFCVYDFENFSFFCFFEIATFFVFDACCFLFV